MKLQNAIEEVQNNPELSPGAKQLIIDKLSPLDTDRWIYRAVVTFLGIISLLTVGGSIVLIYISPGNTTPLEVPDGIIAIGSAAIGALAGLLSQSSR
jgi:hypothetical protein